MAWPAYTLAEMRTLVRQRADMDPSDFVTDAEVDQYITEAAGELHELLIATRGSAMLITDSATTTAGVSKVELAADIHQLVSVRYPLNGYEYPMQQWDPSRVLRSTPHSYGYSGTPRYRYTTEMGTTAIEHYLTLDPPPKAAVTLNYDYIPSTKTYDSDTDVIGLPFPEYIILGAAIRCIQKEKTDHSDLDRDLARVTGAVQAWHGPPDRRSRGITDNRSADDYLYDDDAGIGWGLGWG